jgi:hypothetical protein
MRQCLKLSESSVTRLVAEHVGSLSTTLLLHSLYFTCTDKCTKLWFQQFHVLCVSEKRTEIGRVDATSKIVAAEASAPARNLIVIRINKMAIADVARCATNAFSAQ